VNCVPWSEWITVSPRCASRCNLAEITVHIERDEAHRYLLPLAGHGDEAGKNDNYGSVLTAHPGSRRGGQLQTTGSQPIVSGRPAQPTLSLKPLSRNSRDASSTSGRKNPTSRSSSPYNAERPHRSLELAAPASSSHTRDSPPSLDVHRRAAVQCCSMGLGVGLRRPSRGPAAGRGVPTTRCEDPETAALPIT